MIFTVISSVDPNPELKEFSPLPKGVITASSSFHVKSPVHTGESINESNKRSLELNYKTLYARI